MKGIVWKNATSSTELPRDFCAGIGPLQLGVVLVCVFFKSYSKYIIILFVKHPFYFVYKYSQLIRLIRNLSETRTHIYQAYIFITSHLLC